MAKKFENEKDFLIIETSAVESTLWGGVGICDFCNKQANQGYLIAVLNRWYCKECFAEWIGKAKRYSQDIQIEEKNYAYYANELGLTI